MRKKIFSVFVLSVVAFALFAADIETVLAEAKEKSSVYQGYEISHRNTLITQEKTDLGGAVVSVSSGYDYSDKKSYLSNSSVSVTVPDLYDDIKLTFATNLSGSSFSKGILLESDTPYSITPSLSISKDFEIKSYTDTREEMEDLKFDLQTEVSYRTNVYNFENNFINAVVSIMQSRTNIESSQVKYDRSVATYENSIKLGAIEKDGLNDIEQQMNLTKSKSSLDTQKVNYLKSLSDFNQQYGIDFSEITEVRDADLTFNPSEDGNSNVLIAYYNLETARQKLAAEQGYTSTLGLSGTASSSLAQNSPGKAFSSLDVKASLSYTADNWKITSSFNDSLGKDVSQTPSVSISGSWSSSTTKSKSDSLTVQELQNKVLEAETTYNNTLYNYKINVQTLEIEINNHISDVEQLEIQTNYHKSVLDYQTRLYELGLASQQTVSDAQTDYNNDLQQAIILKLKGLVLENKIKTIEL